MRRRRNRIRNGTILAELKFSEVDIYPRVFDSTKANITEKKKGMIMIEKIENRFSISKQQMDEFRNELEYYNEDAMTPTFKEQAEKPVEWTRDEKGNIISPFDKKVKEGKI